MQRSNIRNILNNKGLKITPQRIEIYEAINKLDNHPTAEKIISEVQKNNPNIAIGTIYKTLETFIEKGLLKKVKTEKDSVRYDSMIEKHHHLYSTDSEEIVDYINEELDEVLASYFRKKGIPDFEIEEIKLQINGKFLK